MLLRSRQSTCRTRNPPLMASCLLELSVVSKILYIPSLSPSLSNFINKTLISTHAAQDELYTVHQVQELGNDQDVSKINCNIIHTYKKQTSFFDFLKLRVDNTHSGLSQDSVSTVLTQLVSNVASSIGASCPPNDVPHNRTNCCTNSWKYDRSNSCSCGGSCCSHCSASNS